MSQEIVFEISNKEGRKDILNDINDISEKGKDFLVQIINKYIPVAEGYTIGTRKVILIKRHIFSDKVMSLIALVEVGGSNDLYRVSIFFNATDDEDRVIVDKLLSKNIVELNVCRCPKF